MRINKFLAESGVASRRASDKLIIDGVVKINGKICNLGDEVDPSSDSVTVNGKKISGAMCTNFYNKINFMGFFVSYQSDIDIIKNICTKPMEKIPKGLGEYGIKTEEVRDMFIAFAEKYYEEHPLNTNN